MALTNWDIGACCCVTPCLVNVCVVGCNGAAVVGATVTIKNGATTVVTGTTGGGGCCAVNVVTAGAYTVKVTDAGYFDYSEDISLACNDTVNVTLILTSEDFSSSGVIVYGCAGGCLSAAATGPLQGATVTVAGVGTFTTDVNGIATVPIGRPGSYAFTASYPRYATQSGTLVVTSPCAGASATVTLLPAAGYVCPPWVSDDLTDPVPTTLHLTDPIYGACTLTYDATTCKWTGSTSITYPAGCGCAGNSVTINYAFNTTDRNISVSYLSDTFQCPKSTGTVTTNPVAVLPVQPTTVPVTASYSFLLCNGDPSFPGTAASKLWPGTGHVTITLTE